MKNQVVAPVRENEDVILARLALELEDDEFAGEDDFDDDSPAQWVGVGRYRVED